MTLFDGGFGSQLAARGIEFDCPERLNLTRPDDVRAIHAAYVEAGADVIETNTLGASPIKLRRHGLERESAQITRAAVENARASGASRIACSMGTTGEFLSPIGALGFEEAVACFFVQAKAARDAGADFILAETLTDLDEARAMLLAARAAGIPYAASFTFQPNGRTLTGSTPECCALAVETMGASAVGINCVGEPELLLTMLGRMRAVSRLPIIAQPNAGMPETVGDVLTYPATPGALLPTMQAAIALGCSAIGGCCGTTPAHIRSMATIARCAKMPKPGGDGVRRVSSLRQTLALSDALASHEEMQWDNLDMSDAPAVLLDLRGASPEEAFAAVEEAQTLCRQPLLFRADDEAVYEAASRRYAGVTANIEGM